MIGFIVGIGVVLLVVILFTIFRLLKLINMARGSDKKYASATGNKTNAILMMVFLIGSIILMVWYSVGEYDKYTIPVASVHGVQVDRMFWITMIVTGIVFILTNALLFYFSYRYRYQENRKALYYPDNSKLEVVWTIIPAIVLSILVFYGWKTWTDITEKVPENAEVIEIIGYQFAWDVRYPGKDNRLGNFDYRLIDSQNLWGMDFTDKASFDDFNALEIHIPKGKPVLFYIRARDVLHSVYIPEFRMKMDAVPGMPTRFWFVATKTTAEMKAELNNPDFEYNIFCTEVCGRGHFSMRKRVVVHEPEEYEAWKAEQQPWLQQNPDYLAKVPQDLKEVALISSGLDKIKADRENEVEESESKKL